MGVMDTLKHAFHNVLSSNASTQSSGPSSYLRPDRVRPYGYKDKTMMTVICTRIALDVSALSFNVIQLDKEGRFGSIVDNPLNKCLTIEANTDQSGRELIMDAAYSMLEEGCIGLLPIETNLDPRHNDGYSIYTMRVCKILEWFPKDVRIRIYNEHTGLKEERTVPKKLIAICENPFYQLMNEPNSTGQRLTRKLSLLDSIDEQSGSGKLDLIIQLPYNLKSQLRKDQAEERRKSIEMQLTGTKYGIAYADATEKITQLNRPVENNLMKQVEYLTNLLLSQIGMTQGILDGTANATTMQNYYNRIVEPCVATIVASMNRTFISKTSRTQGKVVRSFFDPFKLVPASEIVTMAESLTRNEILSSNEIREILGRKPSTDPRADELKNKNLNEPEESIEKEEIQNA